MMSELYARGLRANLIQFPAAHECGGIGRLAHLIHGAATRLPRTRSSTNSASDSAACLPRAYPGCDARASTSRQPESAFQTEVGVLSFHDWKSREGHCANVRCVRMLTSGLSVVSGKLYSRCLPLRESE